MKKSMVNILLGLLFLVGFGILAYPTVSNQWNTYRQNRLISNYEAVVTEMAAKDFTDEWEKARNFNAQLLENDVYRDAFGVTDEELESTEYWQILNVAQDGVMGYLSIPKINERLAIYHGTDESVIQTGVGHINGTKLPIGGDSTHSVLAGHRGLPSAKLFTDLDQMEEGDKFYIHVLDETLAYEVDQILDMIDKDDMEALGDALSIVEGEDHVTLFTCTPYGVNSHRLLIRGTRVPYNGEDEPAESVSDTMLESVQDYYMIYLILGLAVTVLLIIAMKYLSKRKAKGKNS